MVRSLFLAWRILRYLILVVLLVVFFSHAYVRQSAAGRIVSDPLDLPEDAAALVLGTSQYTRSGRRNEFFEHRINAAVEAIEAGRVTLIVASGHRSEPGYNEPGSMYEALTGAGVDPELILLDYGGARTMDSVRRMATVFGYSEFVIISQPFHLERALFLSSHLGLNAWGYAAADATGFLNLHIRLREYLARVQAVIDVLSIPVLLPYTLSHENGT